MNIGVRLFLSSMLFAIVIASVYGWTTHDVIGIILLSIMALALSVVAVYITVAERKADLPSDRETFRSDETVGQSLGVFSLSSASPMLAALATVLFVCGCAFAPGASLGLALISFVLIAFTIRALLSEST